MTIFRLDGYVRDAARQRPDAVAVRDENGQLTYAELDHAADLIAAALIEQGVSRGDRVALYAEKSVGIVASLYGVLRAGATYVPVDVRSPSERAAAILADADAAAAVVDVSRLPALLDVAPLGLDKGIVLDAAGAFGEHLLRDQGSPRGGGGGVVSADTAHAAVAGGAEVLAEEVSSRGFARLSDVLARSKREVDVPIADADTAYILYTSGSTGTPKGVVLSHRNALTFIEWARDEFQLGSHDVLSSHAPLHFDLSTFDLYGAAAAAATVTLVPRGAAQFPVRLAEWLRSEGVTVWYSVPSALTMLVRFGGIEGRPLESLRLVLFAGEVFPPRYLSKMMRAVPQPTYVNLYGPTETNVCTFHVVTEPPDDGVPVPIGQACANTRCVVIDDAGQSLTSAGGRGELVVIGSTVAQGYWRRPDAAERFIDRYSYRTGDIVEIVDGGINPQYLFIGRADTMVKSRGYRVELGEIEAALQAEAGVVDAVAVAVTDEMFGNRIVAFCSVETAGPVPARDTMDDPRSAGPVGLLREASPDSRVIALDSGGFADEESGRALAEACWRRLPHYMIPERITVWHRPLPRLSNGKHDRQHLLRIATQRMRTQKS